MATMLYEAHRMSTIEPFKISIPKPKLPDVGGIVDKGKEIGGGIADKGKEIGGGIADKGKEIGGGIVDTGKDIGGKVGDFGKNVGGKIVDFGKNVGGKLVEIGKGIGKIFGAVFKKLLEIIMWLIKNWKIGLAILFGLFMLYILSKVTGFIRIFTG